MRAACASALAVLVLGGCAHGTGAQSNGEATRTPLAPSVECDLPDCSTYHVLPAVRVRTPYGIGCWGNVPPGTRPNPIPPPLSYLVRDLGKSGTPQLTLKERRTLVSILRYVHSPTLRFVQLNSDEFVIFDAADGACAATHYEVLNGDCGSYYMPGETPYGTLPVGERFGECRHPWNAKTAQP